MKILAIDTATEQVSVAVGDSVRTDAALHVASDRRHVEALVPAISMLLGNLGLSVHDLSAVAVDVGPGLFTGMRVGLATAQTLADLAEIPVVGVDSLRVVAHGALAVSPVDVDDADIVLPILDARRNQVYWSMFRNNFSSSDPLEEVRRPRVGDVAELLEDIMDRGQRALVVGTGAVRYAEDLATCVETVRMGARSGLDTFAFDPHVPHATTLLRLAAAKVESGDVATTVEPMYLRPPDAEINWVTR